MNTKVQVHAAKRVSRYVAGVALVLGVALGSTGIANAGPVSQAPERPAICKVVGSVPVVGSIAGCTTGIPGIPGFPGKPTVTTTVRR